MVFPGQGKKLVIKRKFNGTTLSKEVPTDAIVGARILSIGEVQDTNPKDEATPVQKFRTVRVAGAGRRVNQGTPITVFENDGTLGLFDACQPGDVVNLSVIKMGFNSFKAYHLEPGEAKPEAPTAA